MPGLSSHSRAVQQAAPNASVGVIPMWVSASISSAIRPWATMLPASVPA
nr:hypothetical protein CPGR_00545 [Mycolicibacterium malmesburyense]